jgi:TonB family protein
MKVISQAFLLLFVFACVLLGQNPPKPKLVSAQLPQYPALARLTNTQGEVKVDFTLNASGEPLSVIAVSGHPLLKAAAVDNVKSWRFELPKDLYRTEWKYSSTFNFKISTDGELYENPKLTVVMNSFEYVEVVTNPPSTKYAHDCPSKEQAEPPVSISEGDFVKLSRSGCYGTCSVYEVTVAANGDVTWHGSAFVYSTGLSHSRIEPDAALDLIKQFQLPKFWGLCAGYDASITDSVTTQINVQIGGKSKTVWNYASSAPAWLETFEEAIDGAANTHLWRHGESRTEPLGNIFEDAFMPKPGVTPLMRAAIKADINSIKQAIARGDEIEAVDSSGWTALMYAAASSHSEPVQLLLKRGANPNHKSFAGDTPLMASAIARQFDEDLWRGGAEINAKNGDGVSALMILAARGEADEVKAAINAGADAYAKDAKGRTPLDYLRLANCGKSPIIEWHTFETGGKCDQLDEDEVKQVASLLKSAKQKPKI